MAMQPRAWMTTYLFNVWISHFIEFVSKLGGIFPIPALTNSLILDRHNSHVTLDLEVEAKRAGLYYSFFPPIHHMLSNHLMFQHFNHFCNYKDFQTSHNLY
jgi:hypothetical protein